MGCQTHLLALLDGSAQSPLCCISLKFLMSFQLSRGFVEGDHLSSGGIYKISLL